MGNYAFLVVKNSASATFEVGGTDQEISKSADFVPVAWFAMFKKADIVVTEPTGSEVEYHWRCLSLITTKEKALSSLAAHRGVLLTVFPPELGACLKQLEEVLVKSQGTHVQVVLSDLDDHFAVENREVLERFLDTVASRDVNAWRELVSYVGCNLGGSLNELEFDCEIVENSLVGWVASQPFPDTRQIAKSNRTRKPWWKFW